MSIQVRKRATSSAGQRPSQGILPAALVDLSPPRPMLTVTAVWRQDQQLPALERFFETAKRLGEERRWG